DPEPLLRHRREDRYSVNAVAVSGDGRTVVSGGDDAVVLRAVGRVADARPLLRHEGAVRAVAVSGDGRTVASGGDDACLLLYSESGGSDGGKAHRAGFLGMTSIICIAVAASAPVIIAGLSNGQVLHLRIENADA
ncbi:MAG: hypothetical protein K2X91_08655, partial [Thermoleophilia bacterium]|nr:hypothetical protein [Thermoleophilia bacterium]